MKTNELRPVEVRVWNKELGQVVTVNLIPPVNSTDKQPETIEPPKTRLESKTHQSINLYKPLKKLGASALAFSAIVFTIPYATSSALDRGLKNPISFAQNELPSAYRAADDIVKFLPGTLDKKTNPENKESE